MAEYVKFKSGSFRVDKYGKMSEQEFLASFKDREMMFGVSGDKKTPFLKELYKLIKSEYDKKSRKEAKETKSDAAPKEKSV